MKLTLLLIPLILLSSCTIDWNDAKDAKIAELEKQVTELQNKKDDNIFKKKQECQEKYEKIWWPWNRQLYSDLSIEIFYSEAKNSCLLRLDGWKDNKRLFVIGDILWQTRLFSFVVDKDWNIKSKNNLVESDLDKLKCEFNDALSELWGDTYFSTECPFFLGN